jgi:hypothetical protein
LRDLPLSRADLRGARLIGVDFARADLHAAAVRDASLYGANFRGANLDGIDFAGARLCVRQEDGDIGCPDFRGASERGTHFDGALLCSSHEDRCEPMTEATLKEATQQVRGTN